MTEENRKFDTALRRKSALKNDKFCANKKPAILQITGFCVSVLIASFAGGFTLLLFADGRLFVMLFPAQIADDAVARALPFETAQRAVNGLVFSDADRGHSSSTLLRPKHLFASTFCQLPYFSITGEQCQALLRG